jgi:hypothetical protein
MHHAGIDQEINIHPGTANPKLPIAKSIRADETAVNKWYQHETLAT